jgi:exosortase
MVHKPDKRVLIFGPLLLVGILVFGRTAIDIFLAESDLYSHIPAMYLIIGYVLFTERKEIFSEAGYSPVYGAGLVLLSCMLYFYGRTNQSGFSPNDYSSILSLAFAVYLAGIFLLSFGLKTFRKAQFAVFLLLFTIPIPDIVLDKVIYFLQVQSYNAACWVLDALRLYPIKQGFSIILPGISVVVAPQCSGIRSSIALFIISTLYARYFLRTNGARLPLIILTMFVAPFKNGLRIATLVWLSIYWNKKVLAGSLHTAGGIPFFFIGLAWLTVILFVLSKVERRLVTRSREAAKEKT